jgi:transcriptional regulator with XRE-family HTH domain
MRRSTDNLVSNIIRLMNDRDLTYPQIDRMKIRDECDVTGRFLRQIVTREREPGLKKLDSIADLLGVTSSDLLRSANTQDEVVDERFSELVENYSTSTNEGRSAIELTARIAPKNTRKRERNTPQ